MKPEKKTEKKEPQKIGSLGIHSQFYVKKEKKRKKRTKDYLSSTMTMRGEAKQANTIILQK